MNIIAQEARKRQAAVKIFIDIAYLRRYGIYEAENNNPPKTESVNNQITFSRKYFKIKKKKTSL